MAKYHFDVDDNGNIFPDDEGTDCADFPQLKKEAISALVEMIKEVLPDGDHHRLSIKVRDDSGDMVLLVALHFDVEAQHRSPTSSSPKETVRVLVDFVQSPFPANFEQVSR